MFGEQIRGHLCNKRRCCGVQQLRFHFSSCSQPEQQPPLLECCSQFGKGRRRVSKCYWSVCQVSIQESSSKSKQVVSLDVGFKWTLFQLNCWLIEVNKNQFDSFFSLLLETKCEFIILCTTSLCFSYIILSLVYKAIFRGWYFCLYNKI